MTFRKWRDKASLIRGMTIRPASPADSAQIARVHVDSWRSTYRGILADQVLDELSYQDRQKMWGAVLASRHHHVFVVETGTGEVVGFVAAGQEREQHRSKVSEIYAIYLLEEFQGKGLGKRLFLKTAKRLAKEGYKSMMLWVLANNPTRGFYEAMGGSIAGEKEIEIGGDLLMEVAYRWESLKDLLKA